MGFNRSLWPHSLLAALLLIAPALAPAAGKTFALVSKNIDDPNFTAVWAGCQEAASNNGDRCLHVGPSDQAHFRAQNQALEQILEEEPDAIAISVTNSSFLAKHAIASARDKAIPIITFDSDFAPEEQGLRATYVGPDNHQVGQRLGKMVERLRRNHNSLCLMSGNPFDTNLEERLAGAKAALLGEHRSDDSHAPDETHGWNQVPRCPWYNDDNPSRSVTQLVTTLRNPQADTLVSVGDWPISDPHSYRRAVEPFRESLLQPRNNLVVIATGELRPADYQLLLQRKVHGLLTIDFQAMGRTSYHQMRRLVEGRSVNEYTPTPFHELYWFEVPPNRAEQ